MNNYFKNKNVLITGGLGFIGSNLAIKLLKLGANITILDSILPEYGGNFFNIEEIKNDIKINISDVRDRNSMNIIVKEKDFIFHLAGQCCHILSLTDPYPDIDINIIGTLNLVEACKKFNPEAKIIYTGTRGQYGTSQELPVSEDSPTNPKGIYEISNLTAEKILKVYNDTHCIKTVLLRLTNIFGPRAQMEHSRYGVANWFIRLAIDNQIIKVFGDGSILRDFLYIDDCVDAIILSAISDKANGEIMNVGKDKPISFLEYAKKVVKIVGSGSWEFAPFTLERKAQEPGDFYSDITKIKKILGWEIKTDIDEGIKITSEYYKKYKKYYW
jgi:UDP-glucose 4-epimerase